MKLNREKTLAHLEINGELDAQGLDALVRQLALLRADMTPPVPATRDAMEDAGEPVLIEDKPGLIIAARLDGGFRLWLRHRGLGWLGYQIDDQAAVGLANFVSRRVKADMVNLVAHEEPNRH